MNAAFYRSQDCKIDEFKALTARQTDRAAHPHALRIEKNIPIYNTAAVTRDRAAVMAEWAQILNSGAGALVIENACPDHAAIDAATALFDTIIAQERDASRADHFAAAGKNDRIWNSAQKLCLRDPELFARYFACPAIDAVCEAWLGPGYQMTTQVNLVRPGGAAQEAHRDYHLGFQSPEVLARYPAHAHALSPALTLQGAIAHCDMPIESGPTKLLPFSQSYGPGYLAYRQPEFRAHFETAHVQIALAKGDALFFNPALFHAAGENRSADIQRMANLMQIGSAMGRTLEALDRIAMCRALYPVLAQMAAGPARDAVIAAAAEGYSFPTSLDSDPPEGGLAPETQAALCHRALRDGMAAAEFAAALEAQAQRKHP